MSNDNNKKRKFERNQTRDFGIISSGSENDIDRNKIYVLEKLSSYAIAPNNFKKYIFDY